MSGRGFAASRRSRSVRSICAALGAQLAVRRLEFLRLAIRAQRLFQLAGLFELPPAFGVHGGRREHRPLERNLVVGPIGIVVERLPVEADRRFPVAGAARLLAARERAAGGAPGGHQRRQRHDQYALHETTIHRIPFVITAQSA